MYVHTKFIFYIKICSYKMVSFQILKKVTHYKKKTTKNSVQYIILCKNLLNRSNTQLIIIRNSFFLQ